MSKNAFYGWVADRPDFRDFRYATLGEAAALPPHVDLRPKCPAVYDQGALGSCTANAIGAAFQFERMRQADRPPMNPSRLFIYYNERVIEGSVSEDAGAMIRDGLKTVGQDGVCDEVEWPYKIDQFAVKPPPDCYFNADLDKALQYFRLNGASLTELKTCLAAGFPFVFGFTVYQSFESNAVARTGIVPMPLKNEGVLGGHAVCAVGYDDAKSWFIVRNSWGAKWGAAGYAYFPYAYLTNPGLSSDMWTIRAVAP